MNVRQIAIIGGALMVAGAAFIFMRSQADNAAPAPVAAVSAPAPSKTQVLVAKRDLEIGERITAESLGWQDWPESGANSTAFFTQERTPDATKQFENGVVRIAMVAGEPVTASKIVQLGATANAMSGLLTPGMRATSVSITPDSGVAGFVLPNDRVDIVLTRELQITVGGQTKARTVSSTILENVRILAIDQSLTQSKDQKALAGSTATVELTTTDAEKLRMAAKLGDLSLLLRSYADAGGPTLARTDALAMSQPMLDGTNGTSATSATSTPGTAPQQTAQTTPTTVKVYRGGQ